MAEDYQYNPCPRCGRGDKNTPLWALSRTDNRTYICDGCGEAEALYEHRHPDLELPPIEKGPLGEILEIPETLKYGKTFSTSFTVNAASSPELFDILTGGRLSVVWTDPKIEAEVEEEEDK